MSRRDATISDTLPDHQATTTIDHTKIPALERTIHINISTNLSDLMINPHHAEWNPSESTMAAILQQEQFTDLNGGMEALGDLKSVCLHHVRMTNGCSSIPVAVGLRITGIEETVFSPTAQKFAAILPENAINQSKVLEQGDKKETHIFSNKFPGYTANNLATRHVHHVPSQGVVFCPADHPMVEAIKENEEVLQMGHFAPLTGNGQNGQLYSIGTDVWDHVFPHVLQQVSSQVRSVDMTQMRVQVIPAEYPSWAAVRTAVIATESAATKKSLMRKIADTVDPDQREILKTEMQAALSDIEDSVDNAKMSMTADLNLSYKFLADNSIQ